MRHKRADPNFRTLEKTRRWEFYHLRGGKEYYRARNQALKKTVMLKYGGQCLRCGETDLASLTIDHVLDDGAEVRRKKRDPYDIYRKIVNIPVRSDLQCLCMSCQWKKRAYGPDFSKWSYQMSDFF
jgi:5-methylcytosine-specific restriction endonuclease McrA